MSDPATIFDLSGCNTLEEVCTEVFYRLMDIADGPQLSEGQYETFHLTVAQWLLDTSDCEPVIPYDYESTVQTAYTNAAQRHILKEVETMVEQGWLVQNPETGMFRVSQLGKDFMDIGVF